MLMIPQVKQIENWKFCCWEYHVYSCLCRTTGWDLVHQCLVQKTFYPRNYLLRYLTLYHTVVTFEMHPGKSAGKQHLLCPLQCFLFFNPFPNKPWFLCDCSISLLKTLGKGEIAQTSNFSFCHSVFYPFGKLSAISIKFEIVVCKLFQFGRV